MSTQIKADLHLLLTDACVAVANRGRPLTREGLRAVCQAHLSPKRERSTTPIKDEAEADRLLGEIREQRLAAYKNCPSDLEEDARAEDVLRSEYAGRILPELIQNAHDAIAYQPIGSKGVGFKAVLNISEGPRIHSGPLHCGFDRQRSLEEFRRAGLVDGTESVPLMRLPFPVSDADEPKELRDLIARYDTVVVLRFIDPSTRTRLLEEWDEYAADATLLLFLPGIDSIVWERRDSDEASTRIWRRERSEDGVVEIYDGEKQSPVGRWRLWTSGRSSVALRLDGEGALAPEPSYPNIRAFFETDERSPLRVLIHADFPLKEGRTNVLVEDQASQTEILQLTPELASLVRAALAEIDDAGLLLDFLKPRVEPQEMGKLESKLWTAIKEQAPTLEIPGAAALRLDQVRLRPEDENHQISWWWFGCDLWNAFKEVLSEHHVGGLSGLPFLPPGVDTEQREETLLHYCPDARLTKEELRKLPLLPVEGIGRAVAPDESILFFPPKETPPAPPAGVEVRFLDRRFVSAIETHKEHDDLKKLLTEVCGVCEFAPLTLVEKAILPVLRRGEQPDGLLDFLCAVVVPALKENDLVFDWKNPIRRELTERLFVPVRGNRPLPAAQVYAGKDWTGDGFLERAYGGRNDRGFLPPPPESKKEREDWEKLYRWVGVGWCPKVLPIVCYDAKEMTREGPRWVKGTFPIEHPPKDWTDYCHNELNDFENEPRKARLRQNWTLDGGAEVLQRHGAFSAVNAEWAYYTKYLEAVFYRSSNLREDYDNERRRGRSYVLWLFRMTAWIPVKGASDPRKPEDVFARSEIVRELGGWVYELDGDADEGFLEAIDVRSGWRELDDADWRRWLERSTELSPDKLNREPEPKRAVYSLYHTALRHWTGREGYPSRPAGSWSGPVWCVERRADNTETWRLTDGCEDIYFVDRPELDELRLSGLWVFPVRLNRLGKAAEERFGLRRLSQHLQGQPHEAVPVDFAAEAIRQRLDDCLPKVSAYLEVAGRENPGSLDKSNLPDVKVVSELKVRFRLGNRVVGDGLKLDAYHLRNDSHWTLWLDGALFDGAGRPAMRVWEYVASALVYAGDLPLDAQPCLKDLLLYEGADLERKLLSLGVTKETVDRIVNSPPGPAVVEPEETEQPRPEQGPGPTPPGGGTGPSPRPPRLPGDDGGRGGGGTGAPSSSRRPSISQPGREAEEWMRDELRKRLGSEGWRVSDAPTHDEELRETDIELHHREFGAFHVEVKHCESDVIYWSENEVKKAKDNSSRYFMVILTRNKKEHFEEYWISDPLNDLKDLPRTGVWEWRGRQDGVVLQGGSARWHIPAPKPARPASFSFKVEIRRDWLTQHALDFAALKNCLGTLADSDQGRD